jgi:hypothetical protein
MEQECPVCRKIHADNCDPDDLSAIAQLRRTGAQCADQALFSVNYLRAHFTQQLWTISNDEEAIDSFLDSLEKFVWYLCILNRINVSFAITPLGKISFYSCVLHSIVYSLDWPRALNFLKAKKNRISEIVFKLFELVLEEDESSAKSSDITRFQENLWTVSTEWKILLDGIPVFLLVFLLAISLND